MYVHAHCMICIVYMYNVYIYIYIFVCICTLHNNMYIAIDTVILPAYSLLAIHYWLFHIGYSRIALHIQDQR